MTFVCHLTSHAQAVYAANNTGDDNNPGKQEVPVFSIHKTAEIIRSPGNVIYVMKINPDIYIMDKHVEIATEKPMDCNHICNQFYSVQPQSVLNE